MKLQSMTDFVLEISEQTTNEGNCLFRNFNKIKNYANFLKQPLELEMFIPCVDNEPFNYTIHGNKEQFDRAKGKVLFEGFMYKTTFSEKQNTLYEYVTNLHHTFSFSQIKNHTVESLLTHFQGKFSIELTEYGLKLIKNKLNKTCITKK